MRYVGPWELDKVSLEHALNEWVSRYSPTDSERDQVDDWLRRAEQGPWFVGIQDEENKDHWFGVPKDTNIVIEYASDISIQRIWVVTIRPRD